MNLIKCKYFFWILFIIDLVSIKYFYCVYKLNFLEIFIKEIKLKKIVFLNKIF